jgi:methionine biosynthesis protein MetW
MDQEAAVKRVHYDFDLKLDEPSNAHALQFSLVPKGARVLDVGCGSGILGEALINRKECKVDGVDADPEAVAIAATRLSNARTVDLEHVGWIDLLTGPYDAIIFGDVLEHTKDPEAILQEAKRLLATSGRIIVSLPNVAYIMVRLRMTLGIFNYGDNGILDRGHLRFFTRKSARELIESAGYRITQERYASFILPWGRPMPRWMMRAMPGLWAAGFVFEGNAS